MLLKLAWRNLWRNRRRTLITTSAVFFAVLLSAIMSSLQQGTYEKQIENLVGFYTGYVQVHQEGYWEDQVMDNSFIDQPALRQIIAQHPKVTHVIPRLEGNATPDNPRVKHPFQVARVTGVDPAGEQLVTGLKDKLVHAYLLHRPGQKDSLLFDRQPTLHEQADSISLIAHSSYLEPSDSAILIAQGLAEKMQVMVGDTVDLIGAGFQGKTGSGKYPVKGILKFGSPELNKLLIYIPLERAKTLFRTEGHITTHVLGLADNKAAMEVAASLQPRLDSMSFANLSADTWQSWIPSVQATVDRYQRLIDTYEKRKEQIGHPELPNILRQDLTQLQAADQQSLAAAQLLLAQLQAEAQSDWAERVRSSEQLIAADAQSASLKRQLEQRLDSVYQGDKNWGGFKPELFFPLFNAHRLATGATINFKARFQNQAFEVMDWKEMNESFVQLMEVDVGGNYIYLGILYLVVAFGIFGTILMMIQERRFEFGVMVAVGMKRLKLSLMVVLELLLITALGVVSGLLGSLPISYVLTQNPIYLGGEMKEAYESFGFEPVMQGTMEPNVFVNQAMIVFVMSLILALYPIWKLSKMNPIQSMRR